MILRQLFDSESSTYTYLIADPETREAALIDPVLEQIERDLKLLNELGLKLVYVLETHVHADHVTAAGLLRERTGAATAASASGAPCISEQLFHGHVVRVGSIAVTALSTPGHTDDGMCFLAEGHVFTGDTLLIRGCGRSDFQNGNPGQLFDSITRTLFTLPDDTVVLPAHDYKGLSSSTIGEEKRHNPRLVGKTRDQFIALMNGLNLPPPKKLDLSVPANRACGLPGSHALTKRSSVMSLFEQATSNPQGFKDVSPQQVHATLGQVRLIDVREPGEYNAELGHIAGTELVPLATVPAAAAGWDRGTPVVMVCRSGGRSGRAAQALASMGFSRVMNMVGGMLAYNAAGLPVTRALHDRSARPGGRASPAALSLPDGRPRGAPPGA